MGIGPGYPTVSCIIPIWNGEKYLAETIESVLKQSYRPIEVVVIDDGSRDTSAAIAKGYGRQISYFFQPNRGTAAARNEGVRRASGSLIAFLDQDDLWAPDKLLSQVEMLQADGDAGAVFCQITQFVSPEAAPQFRRTIEFDPGPQSGYLPSALLVSREAFYRVGEFREDFQLAEWTDWYIRLTESPVKAVLVAKVLANRRIHPGNKGVQPGASRREYARALHQALRRRRLASD